MSDHIIRAISRDGQIKACAITGRDLVERARQIHHTLPVATAALGRTLLAASMLGNQLKGEGHSLTLQIRGDGPLGTILCVSDYEGNVRGYVQNPFVELPLKSNGKLDVGAAVGHNGTLTLTRDLGMKEPYVGSVALLGGEVAEDVAAYFVESEQIPTACALGVLVDRDQSVLSAGGYLIQLLPGAGEDVIARVEKGIAKAGAVSAQLQSGMGAEELLRTVLGEFELEFFPAEPVCYRCTCSRARIAAALQSLGSAELQAMIDEQGGAEVQCRFCDVKQQFSKEDLEALLTAAQEIEAERKKKNEKNEKMA